MSGSPFAALKEACIGMTEDIWEQTPAGPKCKFDYVHTVFYGCQTDPSVTLDKQEYLRRMNSERCDGGGTNFDACFEYLKEQVESAQ